PDTRLFASYATAQTGTPDQLQYLATVGAICTATGGVSGDGWGGTLIADNQFHYVQVTEFNPGIVSYVMTCVSGSRSSSQQVSVNWSLAPPALIIFPTNQAYAGAPDVFSWQSNQSSCVAGGGTPGDGWSGSVPGSGQVQVVETQPGTYNYTLVCGVGAQSVTETVTVTWAQPTVALQLNTAPG